MIGLYKRDGDFFCVFMLAKGFCELHNPVQNNPLRSRSRSTRIIIVPEIKFLYDYLIDIIIIERVRDMVTTNDESCLLKLYDT